MTMFSSPSTRSTSRPSSLPARPKMTTVLSSPGPRGRGRPRRREAKTSPSRTREITRCRTRAVHCRWTVVSSRLLKADDLDHRLQRHGEDVAGDLHHQAGQDGQRQGQLDRERRAAAGLALHLDRAAEVFDLRADDVHAHAPPRHLGHFFGGAEAGFPDQLMDFRRRHVLGVGRRDQAALDGLAADAARHPTRRRRRGPGR